MNSKVAKGKMAPEHASYDNKASALPSKKPNVHEDGTHEKSAFSKPSITVEAQPLTANLKLVTANNLDLHDSESKVLHHTDLFDDSEALYRRGFPIDIKIRLNQAYDEVHHKLSLLVTTGPRPIISKGTLIKLTVQPKQSVFENGWELVRVPDKDAEGPEGSFNLCLRMTPPITAKIGIYRIALKTQYDDGPALIFQCKEDLYLLFNPWHKEDSVYLPNRDDINEYILNVDGIIYLGSAATPVERKWNFGQFERGVVETAFWLIEKAGLPTEYLNDPVLVCRSLAAMINGADRGALERYKPNEAGLLSHQWPGTVSILSKLLQQKGGAVKFGSDWTFAAVFCSLNRALGLPCRVVTGYNVAFDSAHQKTIDVHWSCKHVPINELNVDTTKILHTWNEIFVKRCDLVDELSGWQAVDCTPHSGAESLYRLGPAPVKAINSGNLSVTYDTTIFSSMTNGCIVHWEVEDDGDMRPIAVDCNHLGTKILTKSKDSLSPECLTEQYKLKDCSCDVQSEAVKEIIKSKEKDDIDVQVTVMTPDDVQVGDTIIFNIQLENTKNEPRTVKLFTSIMYESYHEFSRQFCKQIENVLRLAASEKKILNVKMRSEDYVAKVSTEVYLKTYFQAFTVESDQIFCKIVDVHFVAYEVIKFPPAHVVTKTNKPFDLILNIENPFRKPLNNCLLAIEGPSTTKLIRLQRPIRAQERIAYRYPGQLQKTGDFNYYITLLTSELVAKEAVQHVKVEDEDVESVN